MSGEQKDLRSTQVRRALWGGDLEEGEKVGVVGGEM